LGKTVSIITLGCKVNFTDSQQIAESLRDRGFAVVFDGEYADISIVNTCTVTARADYQSRQQIRRAARVTRNMPVVVTGCASSVFPERILDASPGAVIVASDDRDGIVDAVSSLIGVPETPQSDLSTVTRTRAFLKIQEGCNAGCTYCIVPRARGRERSKPPDEVLAKLSDLVRHGYKEVVLVGIHLGRYGSDLKGQSVTLAGLIGLIEESGTGVRVRLSSIEPMELTDELLAIAGRSRVIVPHLHIPVQSGDDSILESMGRPYRRHDIERVVENLLNHLKDPSLGIDVMVGFPGEGDREFSNTIDLVRSLPVSYLHVFPFSNRPNTRASTMSGHVPTAVKTARAQIARELGAKKKKDYIARNIGKRVAVLVESHETGIVRGKSENYLDVYIPGTPEDLNSFVPVVLERPFKGGAYGRRSI
jgi:threonylcarbamoyladenosine tRNA methylthiotransferase MtaB